MPLKITNPQLTKIVKRLQRKHLDTMTHPTYAVKLTYIEIKLPIEYQVYDPIWRAIYEQQTNSTPNAPVAL